MLACFSSKVQLFTKTGRSELMDVRRAPAGTVDWPLLSRCLTCGAPPNLNGDSNYATLLAEALKNAFDLGAVPFEVIAGTPTARYGGRVTFRLPAAKAAFLAAFGLDCHPWGEPNWVGLRDASGAGVAAKAYHAISGVESLPFEPRFAEHLYPVMASLYQCGREDYLRFKGACDWGEFARACFAPLGGASIAFAPVPSSKDSAFCVSVRVRDGILEAITVLADFRALPDDDTIRHLWAQDMSEAEAGAYELALAAVRSCGRRRLGGWHEMLSWTVERDGTWHKAASLRFPSIARKEEVDVSSG
jgi:hypothetical protein